MFIGVSSSQRHSSQCFCATFNEPRDDTSTFVVITRRAFLKDSPVEHNIHTISNSTRKLIAIVNILICKRFVCIIARLTCLITNCLDALLCLSDVPVPIKCFRIKFTFPPRVVARRNQTPLYSHVKTNNIFVSFFARFHNKKGSIKCSYNFFSDLM